MSVLLSTANPSVKSPVEPKVNENCSNGVPDIKLGGDKTKLSEKVSPRTSKNEEPSELKDTTAKSLKVGSGVNSLVKKL